MYDIWRRIVVEYRKRRFLFVVRLGETRKLSSSCIYTHTNIRIDIVKFPLPLPIVGARYLLSVSRNRTEEYKTKITVVRGGFVESCRRPRPTVHDRFRRQLAPITGITVKTVAQWMVRRRMPFAMVFSIALSVSRWKFFFPKRIFRFRSNLFFVNFAVF